MLNVRKIELAMNERKITKVKLCKATGIARTTLDAILNGSDAKISTIEVIASKLQMPIGYFFDEQTSLVHTEGDYSPATDSGDISVVVGDAVLAERVKALEALLAEKDERINELKERIEELKER